jgi:pimeloyl-ACP methyl ester carboxylesterase
MPQLDLTGSHLEYQWIGPAPSAAPTLVFLHEGLGSVSTWRDFPEHVARRTGLGVLVYSRLGHGASAPYPRPRPVDFMHREALDVLPRVLAALGVHTPILLGHSDGASIALIHAGAAHPVRGLILEAPHVFVEDLTVESIARLRRRYDRDAEFRERMARHHRGDEGVGMGADALVHGWTDVWLSPEFRAWNIEAYVPPIDCPVLLIQGEDDEYGTVRQIDAVRAALRGPAETLLLAPCGHAPHRDRPAEVLDRVARWVTLLGSSR